MSHPYEPATKAEVEKYPGVTAEFSHRGKHKAATLFFKGRSRFVIYPRTPGDRSRGLKNHIADVRRELANLGARQPCPG